jgi:hypothetical protein
MESQRPPNFADIADPSTKQAFLRGSPEAVLWLTTGTKLFKWTQSITGSRGVSPWWQFLEQRRLPSGADVPGLREMQIRAARLGAHDRDFTRSRLAVTEQWNKLTRCPAIELLRGAWGFVGKAAGQRKDLSDPQVFFIGGDYQIWIPGLTATDIKQISILPYLAPNTTFGRPA